MGEPGHRWVLAVAPLLNRAAEPVGMDCPIWRSPGDRDCVFGLINTSMERPRITSHRLAARGGVTSEYLSYPRYVPSPTRG